MNYGNLFDEMGRQIVWNATSLSAWDKCPRYYQYTILEGKRIEGIHLTFGTLYAKAHMVFWQQGGKEKGLMAAVNTILTESADWPDDHLTKNRFNLTRTFVWYVETFHDDPLPPIRPDAVEIAFAVPVDGPYTFVGTIDRLSEYNQNLLIVDQKTTGSALNLGYFDQFRAAHQTHLYTFAARIMFDQPVQGFLIDAAQITATFSRFDRHPIYIPQANLEEWYEETQDKMAAAGRGLYPRRQTSCTNGYIRCPFLDICTKPAHVRQAHLARMVERQTQGT